MFTDLYPDFTEPTQAPLATSTPFPASCQHGWTSWMNSHVPTPENWVIKYKFIIIIIIEELCIFTLHLVVGGHLDIRQYKKLFHLI